MVYPFQASIVGLETIRPRARARGRFDFLHEMANSLQPGQVVRLICPNKRDADLAVKVWMRIKGKGTPRTTIRKSGEDQWLGYYWFEDADVDELIKDRYLAKITIIRKVREGEVDGRLFE